MDYRREIDGLRALAVLPVILFHAGFTVFSGGFVGVDVFFVISGYLITSIIISEKQAGTFSLGAFYERRARRILPALFVVMAACLPFAWSWLMPEDMRNLSLSLIAVPAFVSNILFWRMSGYFETDAGLNPLLHTWSLAVEEQYYLLFPLFLMLTWRLGRRWILSLLVLAALMGLAGAHWGSVNKPSATFYLLPTRGWEILVGSLVAFYCAGYGKVRRHWLNQVGSLTGFFMIACAIFAFDEKTPFPSLYTLLPVAGAAFIILFTTPQTLIGRLLAGRLVVGLGLISYSAYLWHQPLFAFARYGSAEEPGKLLFSVLVAAVGVLAYLSWKYVEKPFRSRQRFSRKQIFAYGAAGSLLFVITGLAGDYTRGFEYRLSEEQRRISAYSEYDPAAIYRSSECFLGSESTYRDFSSECGNTNGKSGALLLWGDSYAAGLSKGLRSFHGNIIQYTASACPPVIETVFPERPNCPEINQFVMREIERLRPEQIFLHANWHDYMKNPLTAGLLRTLSRIRAVSPDTRIVMIGGPPKWEPTLPIHAMRKGITLDSERHLLLPGFKSLEKADHELALVASKGGAVFLSALDKLCLQDRCLAVARFGNGYQLTAWDNAHLTEASSMMLARKLLAENQLKSQRQATRQPPVSAPDIAYGDCFAAACDDRAPRK